jgi:hypothetical protein
MGGSKDPALERATVRICRRCHDHIETHREESYEWGWLLHAKWRAVLAQGGEPPLPGVRLTTTEPDVPEAFRQIGQSAGTSEGLPSAKVKPATGSSTKRDSAVGARPGFAGTATP